MAPSIAELPWLQEPPADFAEQCRSIGPADQSPGNRIQYLAGFRSSARQSALLARAIDRCRAGSVDLSPLTAFRLGILSSSTLDLLNDCLPAAAARHGVALELLTTPYDQVMQVALDPTSNINSSKPNAVLVAVDHRWLNLDRSHLAESRSAAVSAAIQKLRAVVEGLQANGGAPAILQTLAAPPETLFGSYDRRVNGTVRAMIDEVNRAILALADETNSYLLDVAALAERIGSDRWFDPIQWASYKIPFAAGFFPIYADWLGRILGAIRGKARKCLVLDLDNTIWGGVIGDDGVGGIKLGQGNALGESFLAVQHAALELRSRGVVLAVCSKNDDATARIPFRDHPDMLLREEHIAVFQANWTDKASNLEAIAKALNIGIDALVHLDDNPAERAQIRAALPSVAVPELPNDPSWYSWYLSAAGYFEAVNFSAEDTLRADSYTTEAKRADVMGKTRNLGEYLAALDMKITFSPFDQNGRQRIAQLINKTNQFNLTTRRYTEAQVAAMEDDNSVFTLQTRLADKFGELGMIGIVICRPMKDDAFSWDIDTWLMSCRVLGRCVEEAMLAKVVAAAKQRGARRLIGTYIPTAKNGMVAEHYRKLGFEPIVSPDGKSTAWELIVSDHQASPLPMAVDDRMPVPADAA